jgi:pimeloyl-ACP methyl ester carboxylesterase
VTVVLVGGMGGAADMEFLAPMLGRSSDVRVLDPREPIETDADSHLVGYSLGATLAAAHAATHEVATLTILAGWVEATDRLRDWSTRALEPGFAPHTMLGPTGWGRPARLDADLVALAARTGVGAEAGGIRCPTLVVGATYDLIATTEQTRLFLGLVPDARYTELPTGHAMLAERPAQVHAVVDAFLREPARHGAGATFEVAGA